MTRLIRCRLTQQAQLLQAIQDKTLTQAQVYKLVSQVEASARTLGLGLTESIEQANGRGASR